MTTPAPTASAITDELIDIACGEIFLGQYDDLVEYDRAVARAVLALAPVAGGVPAAWKLVPTKPTDAMLKAELESPSGPFEMSFHRRSEVYRAMLDAAPAAPKSDAAQPAKWQCELCKGGEPGFEGARWCTRCLSPNSAIAQPASSSAPAKCACVYATSANTESVRKGYEMGGYVKEFCSACMAAEKGGSSAPAVGGVELLQQALEALESATTFLSKKVRDRNPKLIAAIRAALADAGNAKPQNPMYATSTGARDD